MTLQLTKKHSFDMVYDSQKVYRLILEAMSYPGRIVNIKVYADKLYGNSPELLAVAMTLLDNEVGFYAEQALSDEIAMLTLSKKTDMESADFIFVFNYENLSEAIEKAKCGTLADPHKSATVIIYDVNLKKQAVALRDAQNYEYPQGIDMIFISKTGDLFAVPRLAVI